MSNNYNTLATTESIQKTIENLASNGITAKLVANPEEAKNAVLSLIPEGEEVFTFTSVTLDTIGVSDAINGSDKHISVRNIMYNPADTTDQDTKNKLGAAPHYAIGSVHAVTEKGQLVIVSNTGSQLPAYAYGAQHVVFVVGTQKIVENLDTAMDRINDYVLPLESERARKAYGVPGSNIGKVLIINKEIKPDRVTVLFVNESLGY